MSEYIDIIYVVIASAIIWIWLTHRQYVKDEKELELKRKQDMCHHEYIEVDIMKSVNSIDLGYVSQQHHIPKIDPKAENKALREQTDAFESVILTMIMDNAMENEKNLFTQENDPGDKIYKSIHLHIEYFYLLNIVNMMHK